MGFIEIDTGQKTIRVINAAEVMLGRKQKK